MKAASSLAAMLLQDPPAPHLLGKPAQGTGHPITEALGRVQRANLIDAILAVLEGFGPRHPSYLDRRPGRLRHRPTRGLADAMRLAFPWMDDAELARVASYIGEQIRHMRCISRPGIDVAEMEAINRNAAVEPGDGVTP